MVCYLQVSRFLRGFVYCFFFKYEDYENNVGCVRVIKSYFLINNFF